MGKRLPKTLRNITALRVICFFLSREKFLTIADFILYARIQSDTNGEIKSNPVTASFYLGLGKVVLLPLLSTFFYVIVLKHQLHWKELDFEATQNFIWWALPAIYATLFSTYLLYIGTYKR